MLADPRELVSRAADKTLPRQPSDLAGPGPLRFTLDGSRDLENLLAEVCAQMRAGLEALLSVRRLEAVLLGGGYGRGEGGVFKTDAGDRPYNDMEFYVFLRGNVSWNERRWGPKLRPLADRLSAAAGLHVETKILSLAKLRRSSVSMFYYDLVAGHRWALGEERLLAGCEHHLSAKQIPLAEATRLLMNRFSGLLFAQERMRGPALPSEDHDFVVRNLAKARLALGDAVLTSFGEYHWSCRERHRRLWALKAPVSLPWFEAVQREHAKGVDFKLHPRSTEETAAALQEQFADLAALGRSVWLWLESRRLQQPFASATDYVFRRCHKCPETPSWRNRLVNFKAFGPVSLFGPDAQVHPWARLLSTLPLLLWEPGRAEEPGVLKFLQRQLRSNQSSLSGLVFAYHSLWRRFN